MSRQIDAPFNDAFFSDGAATGVVATTIDAAVRSVVLLVTQKSYAFHRFDVFMYTRQVHVWSNGEKPFPWAEPPPRGLPADVATGQKLVQLLADTVIAGALIVQVSDRGDGVGVCLCWWGWR